MLRPPAGVHGPSYVISGILLHIGCGRVTVCDTPRPNDSKQSWPAKHGRCCLSLFYPAASLFGDAPRKYTRASVRARHCSLARWTTREFARAAVTSQNPLLHARRVARKRESGRGRDHMHLLARHHPRNAHQHRKTASLSLHTAAPKRCQCPSPGPLMSLHAIRRQNLGHG
jgi:hypothetical protein